MSTGIRYQPRDITLLAEIGELGILDQDAIRTRHFPLDDSGKACPKKLRQYKNLGFILQHDVEVISKRETRTYIVYRLTVKGADEIERLTGRRPKRAGGTKPPESKTLAHRLGVVHTRLKFDDAGKLQELPLLEWIMEWDAVPDAPATAELSERIILSHAFQNAGRRVCCWPDAAFRLQLRGDSPEDLLGYVEYDRSTMEHADILEKLDAYIRLIESNDYLQHWPQRCDEHLVRVLFVCQSEKRIANLIEAFKTHRASSFLRFTTADSLVPDQLFTSPIWRAADGVPRSILRSSATMHK